MGLETDDGKPKAQYSLNSPTKSCYLLGMVSDFKKKNPILWFEIRSSQDEKWKEVCKVERRS